MKIPVRGKVLELLLEGGGEPSPEDVATVFLMFLQGNVVGQLRFLGITDPDIREGFEQVLAQPPIEPPALEPRPHLRPVPK
jgi:hypothetical protein